MRGIGRLVVVAAGTALVAGPVTAAAPAPRIELVVDASVDMAAPLPDGTTRMDAVRRALAHTVLRLPDDGTEGSVALHLLGARTPWWSDDACDDVFDVPTEQPVDHERLLGAIDGLQPSGLRALETAVARVLDRLPADAAGPVRLILVLAGDSSCAGDRQSLLEKLQAAGEGLELRVVGVGMPYGVATAFAPLVPTRNASTLEDLVGALEDAVRGAGARRPRRSAVEIALPTSIPGDLGAEAVGPAGDGPDVLRIDGARITGRVLPGRYTLRIVTSDGDVVAERAPLDVEAETDLRIELPPLPAAPPSLEVTPERPMVGSTVWVHRWGAPAPGVTWSATVARTDAPPDSWSVRATAGDDDVEVPLIVPESGSGPHELRILEGPAGGPWAVVGRRPWEPVRPPVLVNVPDTVETGTALEIRWQGPALPGDRIELDRTDPPGPASTVCVRALATEGQTVVRAPLEPGTYRARYLLGPVHATATTRSLELFEILARLDAPGSVAAGADVEVRWEGPGGPHDFLALAEVGAPDDAYGSWSPVTGGSPTVLPAPREPGTWEIRYVAGDSGDVLARVDLVVERVGLSITSPNRVTTGTRFEVAWTGTVAPGDILVVAPEGSPASRALDWAATDAGSPVSLAAPFSPGAFEVRVVRPGTREILASVPLRVVQ